MHPTLYRIAFNIACYLCSRLRQPPALRAGASDP
jgi:hypothetical protein